MILILMSGKDVDGSGTVGLGEYSITPKKGCKHGIDDWIPTQPKHDRGTHVNEDWFKTFWHILDQREVGSHLRSLASLFQAEDP